MRLSREDGKGESSGIESQRLLLESYAREHGFAVYGEYVDDGYSGTSYERPAFRRLQKDIEAGLVNLVIAKDYCAIIGLNQKDLENQGILA